MTAITGELRGARQSAAGPSRRRHRGRLPKGGRPSRISDASHDAL